MRARLYTAGNVTLGHVDLEDGVGVTDVWHLMKERRLFIRAEEPPQAATTLPSSGVPELTLPGDQALDQPAPRRRRPA